MAPFFQCFPSLDLVLIGGIQAGFLKQPKEFWGKKRGISPVPGASGAQFLDMDQPILEVFARMDDLEDSLKGVGGIRGLVICAAHPRSITHRGFTLKEVRGKHKGPAF